MKNCFFYLNDVTFFDKWKVKLAISQQNGCIQYQFSIYFQKTYQLQYLSHRYYSNQEEAFLAAYFYCLRAFLDREKFPIFIVAIPSGKILSINLPAFMLLSIDAVGLNTIDLTIDLKQHERIYHELQQTGTSHQSILLCDGDGKPIACQIQAQLDKLCSSWAILRISTHDNIFEISP